MAFGGQSGINFWTGGREKLDIENLVGDGRKSDIVMACVPLVDGHVPRSRR